MRRILFKTEFADALLSLSDSEVTAASSTVAGVVRELMGQTAYKKAVFLCSDPLERIARSAASLLAALGTKTTVCALSMDDIPDLRDALICDLLFSPSSDDTLTAKRAAWTETMVVFGCPIVSVGIPSGVDPDTGRAADAAVRAQITVAIEGYLPGLFLHDGLDHCGEIRPVGGETDSLRGLARFEWEDAKRLLPPRKRTAHKGDSGKALLCVGSPKYVGAALLSARACLAAGCGILYVACPHVVREALWRLPEAIGIPVGTDWNGQGCRTAIRAIEGMRALGLGCGVGSGDISPLLEAALKAKLPMVLDADGLNCLSRHRELFGLLHEKVVLTPHPGEMGRLTGLPADRVTDDPISLAQRYASEWGCTVLLKGAATVVSDGNRTRIVAEGNAGLGNGGSGDVLTGIFIWLLSQGVEPFPAACLGSFLLGTSADRAFELLRDRMLRATNVIEALEDWNE